MTENHFARHTPAPEVDCLEGPRIGFFGTLDHRIDLELMRQLAVDHPGWTFVLIGPARGDLRHLIAQDNVHWLGTKSHVELPTYLAGLDAIYLPYVLDGFTRHIYPAKIHECLAQGLPVVATALPALESFRDVIRLVEQPQFFGVEIGIALSDHDPVLRQKRMSLARENSWDVRFLEIRGLVESALASRRSANEQVGN